MSKFKGKKTNNAKTDAKKKIRKKILSLISDPSVLEVYCGAGDMYWDVWHEAQSYLGIDKLKFFDKRRTICGDAVKAVSSIDLSEFNIFDIDAYGSPYDVLKIIIERIPRCKKQYGFVITDGISMDLRLGRICKGVRHFTGIDFHVAKRAAILHDEFIKDTIRYIEKELNGVAGDFVIANGITGAAMKYYAFVVTKNADQF